jgi:hypothetical protein
LRLCSRGWQFWGPSAPPLRLPRAHRAPTPFRGRTGATPGAQPWRFTPRAGWGPLLPSTWAPAPSGCGWPSPGQGFYCERSFPLPRFQREWRGWAGTQGWDFANSADVPCRPRRLAILGLLSRTHRSRAQIASRSPPAEHLRAHRTPGSWRRATWQLERCGPSVQETQAERGRASWEARRSTAPGAARGRRDEFASRLSAPRTWPCHRGDMVGIAGGSTGAEDRWAPGQVARTGSGPAQLAWLPKLA